MSALCNLHCRSFPLGVGLGHPVKSLTKILGNKMPQLARSCAIVLSRSLDYGRFAFRGGIAAFANDFTNRLIIHAHNIIKSVANNAVITALMLRVHCRDSAKIQPADCKISQSARMAGDATETGLE